MKIRFIIYLFAFLGLISFEMSATGTREILDAKADSAYAAQDFNQALTLYESSLETYGASPRLYYNLGNTYFRLGNLGKAVLSYERALRLDPSDTDARMNLGFVMTKIEDRPEDDSSFLNNVHHSIMSWMTPNGWAWASFYLFLVFLLTVGLYVFSRKVLWRKIGFFGGIAVLLMLIYSLIIANESYSRAVSSGEGVVIVPSTNLNSVPRTPTGTDDKIVPLHEGTRVEVLDSLLTPDDPVTGKWYEVKINNSTRAWIDASAIEKI